MGKYAARLGTDETKFDGMTDVIELLEAVVADETAQASAGGDTHGDSMGWWVWVGLAACCVCCVVRRGGRGVRGRKAGGAMPMVAASAVRGAH